MAASTADPTPICSSCDHDIGLEYHDSKCPEAWLAQDRADSLAGSDMEDEEVECGCKICTRTRHIRDVIIPRLRIAEEPDWTLVDFFGIGKEGEKKGSSQHEEETETGIQTPESEPEPARRKYTPYEPSLEDFDDYYSLDFYDDFGRYRFPVPDESALSESKDDEEYEIIEETFWCECCKEFFPEILDNDTSIEQQPEPEPRREQEHDLEPQFVADDDLDLDNIEYCDGCGRYHHPLSEGALPKSVPSSELTNLLTDTEYDAEDEDEGDDEDEDEQEEEEATADNLDSESKEKEWAWFCKCFPGDETDSASDDRDNSDGGLKLCERSVCYKDTGDDVPAGQEHANLVKYFPAELDDEGSPYESLTLAEEMERTVVILELISSLKDRL
ncbi:hypothetical protein ONS95_001916 [Cadophora gregata]|uniref:uncharacterized protein n=1 Tax=Cadophora gregata TaxID=51156 RepID=UPI0026DD4DF9|nr:uncharacterized protein ONS95_001916 [Cadophora gregata]KAK0111566.1 hypothetical protein ONS95_001916 [Cadophora gregata]KAK0111959.1 hypothetical protein ONS96_001222 [Cadophora gregata f. sp. sojae]